MFPTGAATGLLLRTFHLALRHLVGPHADARLAVVGQSRGTLVPTGFAVPAVPEYVAFRLVCEDTVQSRAVMGANGRLWESNTHKCNGSGESYNKGQELGKQQTQM